MVTLRTKELARLFIVVFPFVQDPWFIPMNSLLENPHRKKSGDRGGQEPCATARSKNCCSKAVVAPSPRRSETRNPFRVLPTAKAVGSEDSDTVPPCLLKTVSHSSPSRPCAPHTSLQLLRFLCELMFEKPHMFCLLIRHVPTCTTSAQLA